MRNEKCPPAEDYAVFNVVKVKSETIHLRIVNNTFTMRKWYV